MTDPLGAWANAMRLSADEAERIRRSIVARHDQPAGLPYQWWRTQGLQLANVVVQANRRAVPARTGWAA